jgi:hypothetical protein
MTKEVDEMSAGSRGSRAAAWAVEHGGSIVHVAIRANDAQDWAGSGPVDVVPLYLWPALTDEERAVLEVCVTHFFTVPASKILRGLLDRLA